MEKQTTAQEIIFENQISGKGQVSIKNTQNSTGAKINNPIRNRTKLMRRHFTEENINGK